VAYNYFATKIDFLTVGMNVHVEGAIDYLIKSVGSEFRRSIFTKEFQIRRRRRPAAHQGIRTWRWVAEKTEGVVAAQHSKRQRR